MNLELLVAQAGITLLARGTHVRVVVADAKGDRQAHDLTGEQAAALQYHLQYWADHSRPPGTAPEAPPLRSSEGIHYSL